MHNLFLQNIYQQAYTSGSYECCLKYIIVMVMTVEKLLLPEYFMSTISYSNLRKMKHFPMCQLYFLLNIIENNTVKDWKFELLISDQCLSCLFYSTQLIFLLFVIFVTTSFVLQNDIQIFWMLRYFGFNCGITCSPIWECLLLPSSSFRASKIAQLLCCP